MQKDCHPGTWDSSASGHLDSGEFYDQAAVRECEEELGLKADLSAFTQIGKLPASHLTGQEFVRIYAIRHEGPFVLHPDEIEAGKWISVQDLDGWLQRMPDDFAPCFRIVWESVRPYFLTSCV